MPPPEGGRLEGAGTAAGGGGGGRGYSVISSIFYPRRMSTKAKVNKVVPGPPAKPANTSLRDNWLQLQQQAGVSLR
jgi:hypothetical protein